jgi:mannosyltransferase
MDRHSEVKAVSYWLFWRKWSIVLLAFGAGLFLLKNTQESLLCEETLSIAISSNSIGRIWRLALDNNISPFYFIMLHLFRLIFGDSIFVLRAFSALGALLLASLGLGPIRRILGERTGLAFTFIIVCTPIILVYSQEISMYTWAAFFLASATLYGYLAVTDQSTLDWVRFTIFLTVSIYTHFYATLAMTFLNIILFSVVLYKGRDQLSKYIMASGTAALLYLPGLIRLWLQAPDIIKAHYLPPVDAAVIFQTLIYSFSQKFNTMPWSGWCALLAGVLNIWGLTLAVMRRQKEGLIAGLAVVLVLLSFGTVVLFSLTVHPVLAAEYMLPLVGLPTLAMAYGLTCIRSRTMIVLVCISFVLISVTSYYYFYNQKVNGPMLEVTDYLRDNCQPGDVFLHIDEHTACIFNYYLPDYEHLMFETLSSKKHYDLEAIVPSIKVGCDIKSLLYGKKRVWLVNLIGTPNLYAYGKAANYLLTTPWSAKVFKSSHSWYRVTVDLVEIDRFY